MIPPTELTERTLLRQGLEFEKGEGPQERVHLMYLLPHVLRDSPKVRG